MTSPEQVIHVPDTDEAPSMARRFAAVHTDGFVQPARDVVELLVSELVTNAYRHGQPPVRIGISSADATIRVEVHDYGSPFSVPTMSSRDVRDSGGWGLAIVAALSTSWGVSPHNREIGKHVWFELDTAAPFPEGRGVGVR